MKLALQLHTKVYGIRQACLAIHGGVYVLFTSDLYFGSFTRRVDTNVHELPLECLLWVLVLDTTTRVRGTGEITFLAFPNDIDHLECFQFLKSRAAVNHVIADVLSGCFINPP